MKILIDKAKRKLFLYADDGSTELLTSRVIVNDKETPVGSYKIKMAILNPGWMPPASICKSSGLCKYVKPFDPHNPLGDVKIQIDGSIYMHYTNHPELFGNSKVQSHGCIRTESIHKLIEILTGIKRSEYGPTMRNVFFKEMTVRIQ
jgi:murein L,D-transpeptidase YcbB/YkuD